VVLEVARQTNPADCSLKRGGGGGGNGGGRRGESCCSAPSPTPICSFPIQPKEDPAAIAPCQSASLKKVQPQFSTLSLAPCQRQQKGPHVLELAFTVKEKGCCTVMKLQFLLLLFLK